MLGNLSIPHFLQEYWQKKPLLIRNAFPNFKPILTKDELISLSQSEDVQSRLISLQDGVWNLQNGPFKKRQFTKIKGHWTLLVQDINHWLTKGDDLLKSFNFIPHARLDDLMISYAPDGGGVGPHIDSYDVFLLQGSGERLWQIAKQEDHRLIPDAPLRILQHFQPEQEWLLSAGDMLYLPPNYAHNGIARGDSMTYSIGFRAPSYQELVNEFLFYLQDHLAIEGMYEDPDLQVSAHPGAIANDMIDKVFSAFQKIAFDRKDIENFLGQYLSEPKTQVLIDQPEIPLSKSKFLHLAKKTGIRLDLKSRMLFTEDKLFVNGEGFAFQPLMKNLLQKLADDREVRFSENLEEETGKLLYQWYCDGCITIIE